MKVSEDIVCPHCGHIEWEWPYKIAQHDASCEAGGDLPREVHRIKCKCNEVFYVETLTCFKITTSQ